MADINLSPYTAEQQAMDRRRKMAEAMQQQAVLPIEMPTVPGAKVSHLQGLAKLLQGYIAGKNLEKSDAEQKAYESATMEDFAKILRNSGKTETIPGEVTTPAVTGEYPEKQNTLPTGESYPAVDISAGAMPITPSSAEVRAPDRQVPLLTADALNNPNFMKTSAGRMMLAQALLQQKSQEQAAAQAAQAAALQVHPLAAGGALVQNGKVIAQRAKEETFHPPVTQIDPVTGMPQTVAFSNLGTRKVIDTAGAYTPDQWNSMSMADKAKMLFDQYKFGNLSAEQLVQAGQKNAQLGQELQKLQFETGKGGPGPVPIPRNAPMPNLLNPAPVGIPAVNPAATPAVNAQPVVAPGSQVAPVVNQALAPVGKKPYQALNAPSPVATPAPVVAPTPVATGEQPPAGLSPKAQQQWILENAKNKNMTESQANAAAYGLRMRESNKILNDLEDKGITNTGAIRSAVAGTVGMTPFVGEKLAEGTSAVMNTLPSVLGGPSSEQQQVDQARRNFITAVLRKESGASISPSEFANEEKKYFPQSGDTDAVIKQKRAARDLAIQAMDVQSGGSKRQVGATGGGNDPLGLRGK